MTDQKESRQDAVNTKTAIKQSTQILPDHTEARRLLKKGFHLVPLIRNLKQPPGLNWNAPENKVKTIDPKATGYGMPLASNNLCSIDPDRIDLAPVGLAALGFSLGDIMAAGVRTRSTRQNSGGRSAFKAAGRLRWLTFKAPETGTVLELRAQSPNLQDVLPGIVYYSKDGEVCSQSYANDRRFDDAPELPAKLLIWWVKCSEDLKFYHAQQARFFEAISAHLGTPVKAALAISSGKTLAFPSRMRGVYNANNDVPSILLEHGYTEHGDRYAPPTATGKPGVHEIPGKDDLWQSPHASDPLHGTFDAWVANVVLNHGGDVVAAEDAFAETYVAAVNEDFKAVDTGETDEARREHQKRENEIIGEGTFKVPNAQLLTLPGMLSRFVFLSDGSRVADIYNPHYDLAYQDWAGTYAASVMKVKRDGEEKTVSVCSEWKHSPGRKTVVSRTFKADGGLMLPDPNGRLALNTWRPFDRSLTVSNPAAVTLFLEHVSLLFPQAADREHFLDWLAHIEQRPGVLPHTAWVHVARRFGLGRNWLASILSRVWAGSVAANLDLPQMLKGGFNGQLSRKVLAVVDEIREGGRDSQWEHSEKLKSVITEETRLINPKFGRQSVEFNACRWLMFSNHLSAIPMEKDDRRFEVVVLDADPRPTEYYAKLYGVKDDRQFIAAVAAYLGQRDISRFNPGEKARPTEAKHAVTRASQTALAAWCELLVEHWPSDVITSRDLYRVLEGGEAYEGEGTLTAAHRRTLEQFEVTPFGKPVRIPEKGMATRVSVLRNKELWLGAEAREIRAEVARADIKTTPRRALEEAAADAAE
jgi:hypothetical protein